MTKVLIEFVYRRLLYVVFVVLLPCPIAVLLFVISSNRSRILTLSLGISDLDLTGLFVQDQKYYIFQFNQR